METADVVVIGGGVNGASIAYALAARGVKRVILLEQGALAHGASGRSSALVRMHYTNEWDARLAWASFPVFRHWASSWAARRSSPIPASSTWSRRSTRRRCGRNVEMLRGIGINTTALSPPSSATSSPSPAVDDLGAAAYEPDSGYASPVDVVEGFGAPRPRAGRRGAAVDGGDARCSGGESRRGRRGDGGEGTIDAGAVVVAAGAWAPRLCRELGLTLPARPKAIDTVAVTRPPALAQRPHGLHRQRRRAAISGPRRAGLTLVGVPCQEWDMDPDTLGTGLPPARGGRGRAHPHASHPRSWRAPPSPAAIAPSTATAATATPSWARWRAWTASISPPPSAAPASRSRPRWASAWPSSSPRGTPRRWTSPPSACAALPRAARRRARTPTPSGSINRTPPGGAPMTMQFAIQNLLSWRDWQSHPEVYANSLEECRLADELGFHAVWLAEHHFSPYGICAEPRRLRRRRRAGDEARAHRHRGGDRALQPIRCASPRSSPCWTSSPAAGSTSAWGAAISRRSSPGWGCPWSGRASASTRGWR